MNYITHGSWDAERFNILLGVRGSRKGPSDPRFHAVWTLHVLFQQLSSRQAWTQHYTCHLTCPRMSKDFCLRFFPVDSLLFWCLPIHVLRPFPSLNSSLFPLHSTSYSQASTPGSEQGWGKHTMQVSSGLHSQSPRQSEVPVDTLPSQAWMCWDWAEAGTALGWLWLQYLCEWTHRHFPGSLPSWTPPA